MFILNALSINRCQEVFKTNAGIFPTAGSLGMYPPTIQGVPVESGLILINWQCNDNNDRINNINKIRKILNSPFP